MKKPEPLGGKGGPLGRGGTGKAICGFGGGPSGRGMSSESSESSLSPSSSLSGGGPSGMTISSSLSSSSLSPSSAATSLDSVFGWAIEKVRGKTCETYFFHGRAFRAEVHRMGYKLDHNRCSSLGLSISLVHHIAAAPIPRLDRLGPAAQPCAVCCIRDHVPLDVPRRIFPLALKHISTLIPILEFSSCWLDYLRNGKVRMTKLCMLHKRKKGRWTYSQP